MNVKSPDHGWPLWACNISWHPKPTSLCIGAVANGLDQQPLYFVLLNGNTQQGGLTQNTIVCVQSETQTQSGGLGECGLKGVDVCQRTHLHL